jgi:hypothetical protein
MGLTSFCESPRWSADFEKLSLTKSSPCFESCVLRGSVHAMFLVLLVARIAQVGDK